MARDSARGDAPAAAGTSGAEQAAQRLLGQGDGGDGELARFDHLSWVENGGSPPRAGEGVVEIGGLEPSTAPRPSIADALRTFATALSQLADALDQQSGIDDIGASSGRSWPRRP